MNNFTLTKRIAKLGKNSIIVIPSILRSRIKPGDIAKIEIHLLKEVEENDRN